MWQPSPYGYFLVKRLKHRCHHLHVVKTNISYENVLKFTGNDLPFAYSHFLEQIVIYTLLFSPDMYLSHPHLTLLFRSWSTYFST